MPACDKCKDLNTVFPIRLPADLEKATRIAKANVADETIAVLARPTHKVRCTLFAAYPRRWM